MRTVRRLLTVGLSVLSLLALSFTAITVSAGAAGTLPAAVDEVVAATASLSDPGCPSSLATSFPTATPYTSLEAAVAAATNSQTIYVCAGSYDMSTYSNGQVVIPSGLSITIDGYNWDVPPASSDTSSSVNSTTQSDFHGGTGILVESSTGVTISGLTLYENNAVSTNAAECGATIACAASIDVRNLTSGSGDQGESNVTVSNNLFVNTGGGSTAAVGALHFGLGGFIEDFATPTSASVTVLDTNDKALGNVFIQDQGFENNAIEMSDSSGAQVTGNTVNYPLNGGTGADNNEFSALSFPGYDQATTITNNILNGGGMFSNTGSSPDLTVPKSGIKVEDAYGDGCSNQNISGNTVSGFVYDISVISTGNTLNTGTMCTAPSGPTSFTVSNNTLSNARIYGIYVSSNATHGTIGSNVASTTDTEGYATLSYTAGQYDYYDASGGTTTNTWTNDTGTGSSSPSSLETTTTTTTSSTTTTSTTTTTTTIPSGTTTTTVPSGTTTTTVPSSTTTTTVPSSTTTTTVPPTTTTTATPKPVVTIPSVVHFTGGKVVVVVHCIRARCAGILQLTKKIRVKVEIRHSGKFHFVTKVLLLGKTGYVVGTDTSKTISILLRNAGLRLVRSFNGHKFIALLTFTSAAGTKHENISLTVR